MNTNHFWVTDLRRWITENKIMNSSTYIFLLASSLLIFSCQPTTKELTKTTDEINEITYDSVKAKAYGADAYGMKKYVIAFLKRGPNKSANDDEKARLQNAHMENINRLAEEGKLVLAGPFFGNEDLRGIYVFDVESIEEAKALTETDPSIQAGVLAMELKEWYGSAALLEINEIHQTLSRQSITE